MLQIAFQHLQTILTIKELHLPKEITHIYESVFGLFASLQKITIPTTVTSIDEDAFVKCNIRSVEFEEKWLDVLINKNTNNKKKKQLT